MLNLEWYRTFKVIYEAGTLSAAAQVLFISQPGVSLHLSSLETYTGYRLFERDTRKMMATERGTMLYNFIVDHMNKLEEAEQIFHRKSRVEKPTISVGMGFEIFQHTLEPYVSELPFKLVTRFGESAQLLQELHSGALDLVLTSGTGNLSKADYQPFTTEKMVLICGSQTDTGELDELLGNGDRHALKDWLALQTWYATGADTEHLKRFWMASFNALPRFRPTYVLPYFGSILRCIAHNKGFAIVPDFLCSRALTDGSIRLPWPDSHPIENTLHFGKQKKSSYLKEVKQLEDIITKNWISLTNPINYAQHQTANTLS